MLPWVSLVKQGSYHWTTDTRLGLVRHLKDPIQSGHHAWDGVLNTLVHPRAPPWGTSYAVKELQPNDIESTKLHDWLT